MKNKSNEFRINSSNPPFEIQNDSHFRLFSILAHDLRGPVGNLFVLLEMAQQHLKDQETLEEILEECRLGASQAYHLLENILSWSIEQLSQQKQPSSWVTLSQLFNEISSTLSTTLHLKQIQLALDAPSDLKVQTHEHSLGMIIRNLVSNAIKFSNRGSIVHLKGVKASQGICIEVQDEGIGMDFDLTQKLNLRKITSRQGTEGEKGTGLGLALCYDLAQSLGATLEVNSKPGQGSSFLLCLPDRL